MREQPMNNPTRPSTDTLWVYIPVKGSPVCWYLACHGDRAELDRALDYWTREVPCVRFQETTWPECPHIGARSGTGSRSPLPGLRNVSELTRRRDDQRREGPGESDSGASQGTPPNHTPLPLSSAAQSQKVREARALLWPSAARGGPKKGRV